MKTLLMSLYLILFFSISIESKAKMENISTEIHSITIPFKLFVGNIFETPMPYSFGLIAGKNDDISTLRFVEIRNDRLKQKEFSKSKFDPANEVGQMQEGNPVLFMLGKRIISVFDTKSEELKTRILGRW